MCIHVQSVHVFICLVLRHFCRFFLCGFKFLRVGCIVIGFEFIVELCLSASSCKLLIRKNLISTERTEYLTDRMLYL